MWSREGASVYKIGRIEGQIVSVEKVRPREQGELEERRARAAREAAKQEEAALKRADVKKSLCARIVRALVSLFR